MSTERHTFAIKEFKRLKKEHCPELDVTFSFNNSRTKAGICYEGPLEIQLSNYFIKSPVATEQKIRDILLHELAHAIVGLDEMHNEKWKAVAREIGCTADRCSGPFLLKSDYKYLITCPMGCHTRKLKLSKKYMSRPHICSKHRKLLKIKSI